MKLQEKITIECLNELATVAGEMIEPTRIKAVSDMISMALEKAYKNDETDLRKFMATLKKSNIKETVDGIYNFFQSKDRQKLVSELSRQQIGMYNTILKATFWKPTIIDNPDTAPLKMVIDSAFTLYNFFGGKKPWYRNYLTIYNGLKNDDVDHNGWKIHINAKINNVILKDMIKAIDTASEICKEKGFGKIVGGNVTITSTGRMAGAYYVPSSDYIQIKPGNPVERLTATLLHELGHRYWYTVMTDEKRRTYFGAVKNKAGSQTVTISSEKRNAFFWQVYFDLKTGLPQTTNRIPALKRYYPYTMREVNAGMLKWIDVVKKDLMKIYKKYGFDMNNHRTWKKRSEELWQEDTKKWHEFYSSVKKAYTNEKYGDYEITVPGESTSDYGRKNVEEDFAEAFKEYTISGKISKKEVAARFMEAIN